MWKFNLSASSDTRAFVGILLIRIFVQKSEKTNDVISKNAKKLVVPAYSTVKLSYSKIGLWHILAIDILHTGEKFHENMSTTAREIHEIPFFRQKIDCFGNF